MRTEIRELIDNRLTVLGFTKWLNDWIPETVVGQACNSNDCPIANYVNTILRDSVTYEDMSTSVGNPIMYVVDEGYNDVLIYTLPIWTRQFITNIDKLNVMESYVTAQDCLTTIKEIK